MPQSPQLHFWRVVGVGDLKRNIIFSQAPQAFGPTQPTHTIWPNHMAASKLQSIALRCHSGLGDNAHRHRCERSGTGCVKCRSQEEVLCLGQECIGLVLPKRTAVRLMKTSDITAATSSRPSNSQQTCSCCRYHVKFPHPPWHHYLFSRGSTTPVVKSLPAKSQQKRLSFCLACRPLRHPRPDFFLTEPSVRRKGIQLCNVTPVKNYSPWCGEWRNIRSIKKNGGHNGTPGLRDRMADLEGRSRNLYCLVAEAI